MPFEPLSPEEKKKFGPVCQSPQHTPPSHMVLQDTMKWVCPACGKVTIVHVPRIIC